MIDMAITAREKAKKMLVEYELIVNRILPRSYNESDDGIIDEISHLLWLRDKLEEKSNEIERVFYLGNRKSFHQRLKTADKRLYELRTIILNSYPEYAAERQRLGRSENLWWWWLDHPERITYSVRRN